MLELTWVSAPAGHLEAIIGQDDLFSVAPLEIGARVARSVVRIAVGQVASSPAS